MSDEEMRDKALASARMALGGKTELEKAAILHQHIGSRAMSDMVIETLVASSGIINSVHALCFPKDSLFQLPDSPEHTSQDLGDSGL